MAKKTRTNKKIMRNRRCGLNIARLKINETIN